MTDNPLVTGPAVGEPPSRRQPRTEKVELYRDVDGGHRWRYIAGNGAIRADSGEAYTSRSRALAGAAAVCDFDPADVRYIPDTRALYGQIIRRNGHLLEVVTA